MREVIRSLTEQEVESMRPELEAVVAGIQAQALLQRMLRLVAPADAELDLRTLELVREVPDGDGSE